MDYKTLHDKRLQDVNILQNEILIWLKHIFINNNFQINFIFSVKNIAIGT